jgi:putative transposase
VWNLLHEWYTWAGPGRTARRPSIAEIDLQLREARANPLPGWEWLALLPAQATQQVLRHYLRSWHRHFEGLAGPPRFKKRSPYLTVDNPQASKLRITRLNRRWGEVTILMVGRIRFRWTRPLPGVSPGCLGRITGARLVKDPLGWHICFRIEEPAVEVAANPGPPVGVDRGVVHSMALSTGELLDMPRLLSNGEGKRLLGLERKAARQQLAFQQRLSREPAASRSKRQRHTYQQIAGLRARQARRREDWLHKQTTRLAKNHGVVVVEDLRIQNMTRSARGTIDRPGRNVRAKAGLNRSILGMLAYKSRFEAAYSSRSARGTRRSSAQSAGASRRRIGLIRPTSGVWTAGTRRTATSTPLKYCWNVDSPPEAVPPRDAGGLHARRENARAAP